MRSPSTDAVGAPLSAVPAVTAWERQPGGTWSVGGLRMSQTPSPFVHRPVMESEVVSALAAVPPGLLVDCTLGGGGHSAALLDAHPGLRLLGLDRDPAALAAAAEALAERAGRTVLRRARFDRLAEEVAAVRDGPWGQVPLVAVLFDLGVSSPQLDRPERGFSYRDSGPLDMRMDPDQPLTAADVVNRYPEARLATLFRDNGEGRFARRIARAIIDRRPLTDTASLAEVVRSAIPAATRRTGGHPAKRVFQAIRIEVNDELGVLGPALAQALELVAPGGRLAVLAYHSGEDRLVKSVFTEAVTGGCSCPPGLPCVCGAQPRWRFVFRGAHRPGEPELMANRRAQSARLRVLERTEGAPPAGSVAGGGPQPRRGGRVRPW